MASEFPIEQAAFRAGMDVRSFKHLVDRRVIFATPRTRTLQRGRQKFYTTDEIIIASLLAPLMKLGANTIDLGSIADQLRGTVRSESFERARAGQPEYLRITYKGDSVWGWDMMAARDPFYRGGDCKPDPKYILATEPSGGQDAPLAEDFFVIKLHSKIERAEFDWIAWFKTKFSPSGIVEWADTAADTFHKQLARHTPAEVEAFLAEAREAAATGDTWQEAVEA